MEPIVFSTEGFEACMSLRGGLLTRLRWNGVPLLRDGPEGADALRSACYPLVPFGNRVRGNRFRFAGEDYRLEPNTDWDPHYVHGEGWLAGWDIVRADARFVELAFRHGGSAGTPYRYEARQTFRIEDGAFAMGLAVTNRGDRALPFGLGWHPYFPLTPETTLEAPARLFWTETEGWLPGERTEIPTDLDFQTHKSLPDRWVNNGFEDWSGRAVIRWPERGTGVVLEADPLFHHAFVFVSDTAFDPTYRRDYFCFEPMSHLADAHNMDSLGGLEVLAPGETLSGSVRLRPERF